jgi:hypothetical protein
MSEWAPFPSLSFTSIDDDPAASSKPKLTEGQIMIITFVAICLIIATAIMLHLFRYYKKHSIPRTGAQGHPGATELLGTSSNWMSTL